MRKFILGVILFFAALGPSFADSQGSITGGTMGTQSTAAGCIYQTSPSTLTNNQQAALRCENDGSLKVNITGGQGGIVTADQGDPNGGGAAAWPVITTPGQRVLVTLDVKTVTTGGTAVNAISAGNRTAGGFLQNPIGATVALCINEIGTASGTTSSGDTTCIQPGQSYVVSPAAGAVSVVTSDSSHPFSGYGLR